MYKIVIYLESSTTDKESEEMVDYLEGAWGFPAEIIKAERFEIEDDNVEL